MAIRTSTDLKAVCIAAGFTQRGNAYFRLVGDGVLQIVSKKRERAFRADVIRIGLLSMYGCLKQQYFTELGCIARYGIEQCAYQTNRPSIYALPMEQQLQMLQKMVLPWLDTIDTQKKLKRAILALDPRWNDSMKLGPFMACGEIHHAKKVLTEILAQHSFARISRIQYQEEESGERVVRREQEDLELQELLDMLDRNDPKEISDYLAENYKRNLEYASFCIKS